MTILSPSFIHIQNDLIEVNNKGIIRNDQRVYLKLSNVSVSFPGDNKQYESNPSKVKKQIKFVTSNKQDQIVLQFLSDINGCKNDWIKDDTITSFITDSTKFYDKNKNELMNVKLMNLKNDRIDLILTGNVFNNKFGKFEHLNMKQMRMIDKNE